MPAAETRFAVLLFTELIKMMIGPVIFCTIFTGIAGMQDTKKVGRVGLKALIYFEIVSTLALIIGIDRFMSEGRSITNIIGNAVATIVVAKSENAIDMKIARELIG